MKQAYLPWAVDDACYVVPECSSIDLHLILYLNAKRRHGANTAEKAMSQSIENGMHVCIWKKHRACTYSTGLIVFQLNKEGA